MNSMTYARESSRTRGGDDIARTLVDFRLRSKTFGTEQTRGRRMDRLVEKHGGVT